MCVERVQQLLGITQKTSYEYHQLQTCVLYRNKAFLKLTMHQPKQQFSWFTGSHIIFTHTSCSCVNPTQPSESRGCLVKCCIPQTRMGLAKPTFVPM